MPELNREWIQEQLEAAKQAGLLLPPPDLNQMKDQPMREQQQQLATLRNGTAR